MTTLTNPHTGHSITVPTINLEKAERIRLEAENNLGGSSGLQLLGGILTTAFLVEPVGWSVAGLLGAIWVYKAVRSAIHSGREQDYVRESGNYSHLLPEKQLVRLIKLVGPDAVLFQITEARDDGQRLSGAATKLLAMVEERDDHTFEDLSQADLLAEQKAAPSSLVGPMTQLNAVDVQALPVASTTAKPAKASTTPDVQTELKGIPLYDIRELAHRPKLESLLWLGYSQSGKTTSADQVARALKGRFGDKITIYYISPVVREEGDTDERRLFDYADRIVRLPLLGETNQKAIAAAFREFIAVLKEWNDLPASKASPKLFITDELSIIAGFAIGEKVGGTVISPPNAAAQEFFGKLTTTINQNASGGRATGIALWGIAPTGYINGLGLNRNALGAIKGVFIGNTSEWNSTVYDGAAKNGLAHKPAPTQAELNEYAAIGIERVVSVGGDEWEPLAIYKIPRGSSPRSPVAVAAPNDGDRSGASDCEADTAASGEPPTICIPDSDNDDDRSEADGLSELAQKLKAWLYTGAGRALHVPIQGKGIGVAPNSIAKRGHTHRIGGESKRHSPQELTDAMNELIEVGIIGTFADKSCVYYEIKVSFE